jgi:enediyne biosynthesis protein CalE5
MEARNMSTDDIAPRFEPGTFKAEQTRVWDASAPAWEKWQHVIEAWFAPITAHLLAHAGVRRGQRVLDLGTGYGEPALSAARIVGPEGHVHGIDLSSAMLEVARRRGSGVRQVTFSRGDIDTLEPGDPVDVILSRLGLMFMVDRASTLRAIRGRLVVGGVLGAAVWGPPGSHRIIQTLALLTARLALPAPVPGTPGPFALSDGERFRRDLLEAGFRDVTSEELSVVAAFPSIDEFVQFNLDNLPRSFLQAVCDRFGSPDAPAAWQLVREAAQPHVGADGVLFLPCTCLCVRAVA